MARLPRLAVAGQLHLLIQRGHNGQRVFRDAEDFSAYLHHLHEAALLHLVAIHAYALRPAEVMLLATPAEAAALGAMVQAVGRHFVRGYNLRHGRRGALWEGRFGSTVVNPASHGLACLRLVEGALPGAGEGLGERIAEGAGAAGAAAGDPVIPPWSSAAHHCGTAVSPLVSDHALFWQLGNTPFERQAHWRRLLAQPLPAQERNLLASAALGGWVLGDAAFEATLSAQTERRLVQRPRGRPRKPIASAVPAINMSPIK